NQDIIDLYDRVPGKAPVIVTSGIGEPMDAPANRKAIPIDDGVPEGSILLGAARTISDSIF
ncbi:L,D-transpeptidase, partial [Mesorhizobium sp. M6A.T.Ca.TU.002.02.2.1]